MDKTKESVSKMKLRPLEKRDLPYIYEQENSRRVGTVVTLIGQDGDQQITVEDVANYANSIPHEILTTLGLRLPRQY